LSVQYSIFFTVRVRRGNINRAIKKKGGDKHRKEKGKKNEGQI